MKNKLTISHLILLLVSMNNLYRSVKFNLTKTTVIPLLEAYALTPFYYGTNGDK